MCNSRLLDHPFGELAVRVQATKNGLFGTHTSGSILLHPLASLIRLLLNALQERLHAHRALLAQSEASDEWAERAGAERAVEAGNGALELGAFDRTGERRGVLGYFGRKERGESGDKGGREKWGEDRGGENVREQVLCDSESRAGGGRLVDTNSGGGEERADASVLPQYSTLRKRTNRACR